MKIYEIFLPSTTYCNLIADFEYISMKSSQIKYIVLRRNNANLQNGYKTRCTRKIVIWRWQLKTRNNKTDTCQNSKSMLQCTVYTSKDLKISDCKCTKVRRKQMIASLRSSVIADQKYSPEAILLSQGLRNVSTQTVKNEIKTMSLVEGEFCIVTYKLWDNVL